MCMGGLCRPTCQSGWDDCNHPIAPAADDGCETDIFTIGNCGHCGTSCVLPHALGQCPTGTCQIQSCSPGFFDCDGTATSGCECAGVEELVDGGTSGCCGSGCQTVHSMIIPADPLAMPAKESDCKAPPP